MLVPSGVGCHRSEFVALFAIRHARAIIRPTDTQPEENVLSRADNERLTRVGRGTPMGELMRRYWIPAAFSHQIAKPDSPPVRVRLLGEDLVLFRDSSGKIGLLDERCPHRTASL